MFDFILRPFRRNFGKNKKYYKIIDDMFGIIPHNIELYKLALVHRSSSIEVGDGHTLLNNERLEYLGDAVIESVTSDYLFIKYRDFDEGRLTQLRSKLVSRQSLNDLACQIGLDKYVVCSSSVANTQKHIFGDAFEAMMGAIYLDQGYNFVNRLLIEQIYEGRFSVDTINENETDFKSRLIEWGQKNHHNISFKVRGLNRTGDSIQNFHCTISIDNLEVGHGIGSSKKEAEQKAACSIAHSVSDEDYTKLLDILDNYERKAEPKPTLNNKPNYKHSHNKNFQKKPIQNGDAEPTQQVAKQEQPELQVEQEKTEIVEKPTQKQQISIAPKKMDKPQPTQVVENNKEENVVSKRENNIEAKPKKPTRRRSPKKSVDKNSETNKVSEITPTENPTSTNDAQVKKESSKKTKPKKNSEDSAMVSQNSENSAETKPKARRGRPRKKVAPKAEQTIVAEPNSGAVLVPTQPDSSVSKA